MSLAVYLHNIAYSQFFYISCFSFGFINIIIGWGVHLINHRIVIGFLESSLISLRFELPLISTSRLRLAVTSCLVLLLVTYLLYLVNIFSLTNLGFSLEETMKAIIAVHVSSLGFKLNMFCQKIFHSCILCNFNLS